MKEKIIFLQIFFISNIISKNLNGIYRCNHDMIIEKPIILKKEGNVQKRGLETSFHDIKIFIDLTNIESDPKFNDNIKNALNDAKGYLEKLIKVVPIEYDFNFGEETLKNIGVTKKDSKLDGGIKKSGYDLIIFAKFSNSLGDTTLAIASEKIPDNNLRPLVGVVDISTNINTTITNSERYLESILIHEFTHLLGFSSYNFENVLKDYLIIEEGNKTYLASPKLMEVAKVYFKCDGLKGVKLENYGGSGTAGSHWDMRILLGEYMNGAIYPEEQVISEFTLAVLEDLGWYQVNYYTGGLMRFGKGKGCDFLEKDCIDRSSKKTSFKNEFFDSLYNNKANLGCTSGRQGRAYGIFGKVEDSKYDYFGDSEKGGMTTADGCPVYRDSVGGTIYMSSNCKYGNGDFGILTEYPNGRMTNGNLPSSFGEVYGDHSFCAVGTLVPENETNKDYYKDTIHSMCFPMYCSDESLTIQIGNVYVVCPKTGGKINVPSFEGYLICPEFHLICLGTVMCNDMFDCIDKKSERNSVYLDNSLSITSSQMNDDIEKLTNSGSAQELADNGKCKKGASYCIEGNDMNENSGTTENNSKKKKSKTGTIVLAVILIIIFLAIGIAIFICIRRGTARIICKNLAKIFYRIWVRIKWTFCGCCLKKNMEDTMAKNMRI